MAHPDELPVTISIEKVLELRDDIERIRNLFTILDPKKSSDPVAQGVLVGINSALEMVDAFYKRNGGKK